MARKSESKTESKESKIDTLSLESESQEEIENIINSKDYILRSLGSQYIRLKKSCDMKWEQALEAEQDGSRDLTINRRSKKENTDLREYNQQVKAMADVGIKLVAIQKSDFKTVAEEQIANDDEEIQEDDEELV